MFHRVKRPILQHKNLSSTSAAIRPEGAIWVEMRKNNIIHVMINRMIDKLVLGIG